MSAVFPRMQHTPAPWEWVERNGIFYLATPDRGRLVVMECVRRGMRFATPRFAFWEGMSDGKPRERLGGILGAPDDIVAFETHPDARLIAAAPDLAAAAHAALAYDAVIQSAANDPERMSSACTAQGDDLDTLYLRWITLSRAALDKAGAV